MFVAFALSASAETKRQPQVFKTSAGDVKITPVYHASVLIEADGKAIYIDPAKPGDFSGLPKADLILVTHEHPDHIDRDVASIKAVSKPSTAMWAPSNVFTFANALVTQLNVITSAETKFFDCTGVGVGAYGGGAGDTCKFKIETIPAYNLVRGPSAGNFFHPKGVGVGYIINYGGKRFYFSGDTEATPEMKELKNIDVAFVCMNLPYTMTPEEAADAVKAFHPGIVIPYHYSANPPTDLNVFKSKLDGSNIEVRLLDWYPKPS
jgi:L-ascorbate metabolism protein UlaG (beta-lactamase superfamily)